MSRRSTAYWAVLVVVLTAAVIVGTFQYRCFSICGKCGRWRDTTVWELPLLPVPLWRVHRERGTPLSAACSEAEIVPEHEHSWLLGHGGGNGNFDYGEASMLPEVINSEEVTNFLTCVARFEDRETARRWLEFLLNSQTWQSTCTAIARCKIPKDGFQDRDAYLRWRSTAAPSFRLVLERVPGVRSE